MRLNFVTPPVPRSEQLKVKFEGNVLEFSYFVVSEEGGREEAGCRCLPRIYGEHGCMVGWSFRLENLIL